jgi:hypothetical protein
MKTLIRSALLAGGLAVAVGVSPASAQIYTGIKFKTTFPFAVGQKMMPAGTYTVRPAEDGNGALLQIQGKDGSALFLGENAGDRRVDPRQTAVIFDRTGDHYALAEVWDGTDQEGTEAIPTHRSHADKTADVHRDKK